MKGNLIHLNMAAGDTGSAKLVPDCVNNYSLQMAASLPLDDDHVAVSDKELGADVSCQAGKQNNVTVFINGPTGTGKVLAKFIHHQSGRAQAPLWL